MTFSDSFYGTSSYQYTVENSAAAWNSSPAQVIYVEKLPPCGTSLVDIDNGYYGKLGWAGITDIKAESNDTPCNGWHEMLYAQTHLNQSYMDTYSNDQRQSTGAHEMGHPFNLGDEWTDNRQLMYGNQERWTTSGINTPQTDDINGANELYKLCNGK